MHLSAYLSLLSHAERRLAQAYWEVADTHRDEPDIFNLYHMFSNQSDAHVERLQPFVDRYGEHYEGEPDRLHSDLFSGTREGSLALLRDLHDLYLMATEADISWIMIKQAAQGLQDRDLVGVVEACEGDTTQQLKAIKTRMKQAAPQTLIAAS
jgi:hypothetical protein